MKELKTVRFSPNYYANPITDTFDNPISPGDGNISSSTQGIWVHLLNDDMLPWFLERSLVTYVCGELREDNIKHEAEPTLTPTAEEGDKQTQPESPLSHPGGKPRRSDYVDMPESIHKSYKK